MMKRIRKNLHYFVVTIVGILVFLPGIFSSFNSDDFVWLKSSQEISFNTIAHFSVNYSSVLKFRPFTHFLFQLFYSIFRLNPTGYHMASLIFHLSNALIFYALILRFTSDSKLALISSLIFVSHFVQEEALFWISALSSPIVVFFYLCSVWALWKYLEDKKIGFYLLSYVLSVIALLTKEDGITIFLAVLLLAYLSYDFKFGKSEGDFLLRFKRGFWLSLPFMGLTILYLLIRYLTVPDYIMSKFLTLNPMVMIKNICYFGVSSLFPVRLFFDIVGFKLHSYLNYIIQFRLNNLWVILVLFLIGSVFVSMNLYFLKKKIPGFKLGIGLALLGILPYLTVNGNGQRFLYFFSLGFSLALASLLIYLFDKIKKIKLLNLLIVLMLVFNGAVLYERATWWRRSGEVCKKVIDEAGKIISSIPEDSEVYFANLPQRLNGAYTFHTGFEESVSLFYPEVRVKVYNLGQLKGEELKLLRDTYKSNIFIYREKKFKRAW